jgi:hypothetical protein
MSITVEVQPQDIAALKRLTHLESDADAIVAALREFLRLRAFRELKGAAGNIDIDSNWQEFENLELSEMDLPR